MESRARFCFLGRLKVLPAAAKSGTVEYLFRGSPAIKDSIEALGVPHTEVDLIIACGRSVDLSYRLQDSDRIDIFPFGCSPSIEPLQHLSPPLQADPSFVLDVHLGKLARRLRMLGFDCRYRNDYSDPQLIELALDEGRIILTRDRGVLKHSRVRQGYLIGSSRAEEQVREVLVRYRLHGQIRALRRCPQCNGLLEAVEKEKVLHRLQPKTALYYDLFQRCRDCDQLYWQGTHYEKIGRWIQQLLDEAATRG